MKYSNNNNCNEKEYNKKKEGNNTQEKTSDAQCNCSPPTDRCLSSDLPLLANSPLFIY